MATYETIITETRNQTLLIMLNRPKVLNALNRQLIRELRTAIEELYQNPDILGCVLIGTGEKAFAAGADISELNTDSPEIAEAISREGQEVFSMIECSPKPVIAAINGFALGGGCELAMSCHIRVAAEHAKFGQPEVKLGLLAGYGATQRLPRLIGRAKATELLITADMMDAQEALRWGLVNYVVPFGELSEKCLEILRKAYKQSPSAIAYTLEAIQLGYASEQAGFDKEAELFGQAITSADGKEGTQAFLEKRKPNFSGK